MHAPGRQAPVRHVHCELDAYVRPANASAAPRQADLALIDPPYAFADWERLLGLVQAAYVVCEAAAEVPAPAGWTSLRVRRYGRTTVTLLSRDTPDD